MSTKELDSRAAEYFFIMETIEALQAEAEAIKDAMKAAMTEASTEELEGTGWRATWHTTHTSRFDSKRFKAEQLLAFDGHPLHRLGVSEPIDPLHNTTLADEQQANFIAYESFHVMWRTRDKLPLLRGYIGPSETRIPAVLPRVPITKRRTSAAIAHGVFISGRRCHRAPPPRSVCFAQAWRLSVLAAVDVQKIGQP